MRAWYGMMVLVMGWGLVGGCAKPMVIGGSSRMTPPPFMRNSYGGLGPTIERAYPIEIAAGGPYKIKEIQVVAYHNPNINEAQANFSVHHDDNGRPGVLMATCDISGIGNVQRMVAGRVRGDVWLFSDKKYWLVGQVTQGQVNWSLSADTFGKSAFRKKGGEWEIHEQGNICAFAIVGVKVR